MRIQDAYTKLDRAALTGGPAKAREVGAGSQPKAGGAGNAGATGAAGTGVDVKMSSRARELAEASEASSAKVSALREKIQNGTFNIDAHAIAAKLVGSDE